MSILFDGSPSEPKTLEAVVYQAVAAASACWPNLEGAGVFDAERAKTVADEVIEWVRANYEPRLGGPPDDEARIGERWE